MPLAPEETMRMVDVQLAHVWMVRTFLKHSEEAAEDDELADVHRELYSYLLALGASLQAGDAAEYLRIARKKLSKLRQATDSFTLLQPQVSTHTNFQMAARSLQAAVAAIHELLAV